MKVEFIEVSSEKDIKELEIEVNLLYNGEPTTCYALGVYDQDGLRSLRVITCDDYTEIYSDDVHVQGHNEGLDLEYIEQIEQLLEEQL